MAAMNRGTTNGLVEYLAKEGGWGGIRTPGAVSRTAVFKTADKVRKTRGIRRFSESGRKMGRTQNGNRYLRPGLDDCRPTLGIVARGRQGGYRGHGEGSRGATVGMPAASAGGAASSSTESQLPEIHHSKPEEAPGTPPIANEPLCIVAIRSQFFRICGWVVSAWTRAPESHWPRWPWTYCTRRRNALQPPKMTRNSSGLKRPLLTSVLDAGRYDSPMADFGGKVCRAPQRLEHDLLRLAAACRLSGEYGASPSGFRRTRSLPTCTLSWTA